MDRGAIVALGAPAALIRELLDRGYHRSVPVRAATLEDVFLVSTGYSFSDAEERK